MAQFRYQALNAESKLITGEILADSVAQAISHLEKDGLTVQSIGYVTAENPPNTNARPASSDFHNLAPADQVALNSRLTEILNCDRALVPAVSAYAAELPHSPVRRRLQSFLHILQLRDNSQAVSLLAKQPAQWIPLLNTASTVSNHGQLLNALLREYGPLRQSSRNAHNRLVYPTVVTGFAIAVFLFIGIFVVPVFRDVFSGFGLKLPGLTQFVLSFYAVITNGTFDVVLAVILIGVLIVRQLSATSATSELSNGSIGPLNRFAALARFARYIAELLEAGLTPPTALRLAGSAIARPRLKQSAFRVAASIESGNVIATADRRTVTSSILHALQSDLPKSARLAAIRELSRSYEDLARATFSWTEGLVEPISIIVIGLLVAITVVALYLPLLTLINALV